MLWVWIWQLDEQSVQLLIPQLVELLDWQWNCVNIGLTVDPTIDPTVEITGKPVSRTQASDASGRLLRYEAKCVECTRFQRGGRSPCMQLSRDWSYPLPIYWYHSKGNWLRYNFAADSFYIRKLCSRLLVLYCRKCMKDDKFRYLIHILGKLGAA